MAVPSAESAIQVFGRFYKFSRVPYSGLAESFEVDQSATVAVVVEPASGGPTLTLGSPDSNFEKTVTLAAGGSSQGGVVTIVTAYTGSTIPSSKP